MGDISLYTLIFLIGAGFLAGLIDSVVGGGGLISTPALLFTGISPSTAIATSKLASATGSLMSTISFVRSGKVNFKFVSKLIPLTLIGAILGAIVFLHISSEMLKPIVLVLLVIVAIYTIVKKDWGKKSNYKGMSFKRAIIFGTIIFGIGFYDGFFGPGTGSFLLFAILSLGFDFVESAGNAKVLNLVSNVAALTIFLYLGVVNFTYGIPISIAMTLGALVGSNLAIKKGAAYVRVLFILVTVFLIGKNVLNYFHT
ncbi:MULTISPECIES: sulfite exporter TauE/SafE family protein [Priestia]|uniref:sulfite exporter TauE/SafE family protein n=1 Tax=Priestia TaxID=2800373 RepID=UPI0035DACBB4